MIPALISLFLVTEKVSELKKKPRGPIRKFFKVFENRRSVIFFILHETLSRENKTYIAVQLNTFTSERMFYIHYFSVSQLLLLAAPLQKRFAELPYNFMRTYMFCTRLNKRVVGRFRLRFTQVGNKMVVRSSWTKFFVIALRGSPEPLDFERLKLDFQFSRRFYSEQKLSHSLDDSTFGFFRIENRFCAHKLSESSCLLLLFLESNPD